jgi:hypothetical protein
MAGMIDNFHNRLDALYVLEDAQEASRERQKILGSVMLQEKDGSKLSKKFAAKSAANPLGSMNTKMTSRIKPVVKCKLIDIGGEIRVTVSDEDYEEVAAEVIQRHEDQPIVQRDDVAAGMVHEHPEVANDDHQGGVNMEPEILTTQK